MQFHRFTPLLLLLLSFLYAAKADPSIDYLSTALEIRAPGDLDLFVDGRSNALGARANAAQMLAAPLTAIGASALATCRYLHEIACYVHLSIVLSASMTYFGYVFYDIIKRDAIRTANEMQQLSNSVALSNQDVDASSRRLEHEKTTQSYERWKDKQEMRKRSWRDTWQPSYNAYKKLAKSNTALKPKVEEAEKLMEQTLKAEDAFIKAEADSISLEDVLEGNEGTLSIAELRALEEKAEEAIKALQSGLEEIINREESSLETMNEMAFGNKDYNPLLEGHMTRRMLESQLPQLIMERNEDCDTEVCLRLWYSKTLPDPSIKRDLSSADIIHNIYSTPPDYEFGEKRKLTRRTDNYMIMDEFMECEVEEHVEMGNEGVLFRMAAMPGEDTDSLFAIDAMNKAQQAQYRSSLMSGNMTIWESGEWNCVNADTDGGEPAIRAVAIFTNDIAKLNEDVTDKFSLCESALSSST
ncbi:hypothetical protein N7476_002259 [Penicillium atrosanguineum]|uniref:Uncharacterized protein n=1 Tax=Penicillium atrosanguineum TaxID=1132637 RepID=A0A9W9U9I9_9EURO|nr:hypothetical protein N7476_002259 [Penicillium atrosanguineum]